MTASSLGVTTYLVPPITIVLGWCSSAEAPPAMAYVGGVLALVGVAWLAASARPRAATGARGGRAGPVDRDVSRLRQAAPASRGTPRGCAVGSPREIRHSHSLRIEEAKPSSRIVLNDSSA